MSVDLLVQEPVTDLEQRIVEELDGDKVEALQWLGRQLIWERQLTNLRGRAAAEKQDRDSPVRS
jgi:hypothetical protein